MKLQGIQIGLASPKLIKFWAERHYYLQNKIGPITNPQTVNYQKIYSYIYDWEQII